MLEHAGSSQSSDGAFQLAVLNSDAPQLAALSSDAPQPAVLNSEKAMSEQELRPSSPKQHEVEDAKGSVCKEQDAQRRFRKRHAAVAAIKSKMEYTVYHATVPLRQHLVIPLARTPDPDDVSLSKRQWEMAVMQWRRDLLDN